MKRFAQYLGLGCMFFGGCVGEVETVNRRPMLAKEKLRAADCDLAISTYRHLLELPPNASVIVTARPAPRLSPAEQEQAGVLFAGLCHYSLVGKASRSIVRCWNDSPDAATFRLCNNRF